jgi:hypothetical protein
MERGRAAGIARLITGQDVPKAGGGTRSVACIRDYYPTDGAVGIEPWPADERHKALPDCAISSVPKPSPCHL